MRHRGRPGLRELRLGLIAAGLCGCAALTAACDSGSVRAANDVSLRWTLTPDPPAVGRSRLNLQLSTAGGEPLGGARVEIEANMSHPGMRPVLAVAVEERPGVYRAELDFTMAGSWFILVTGELPDGRSFSRRIDVARVHGRRDGDG